MLTDLGPTIERKTPEAEIIHRLRNISICNPASSLDYFRELKPNLFNDDEIVELTGYYCTIADQMSHERRSKHRKLIRFVYSADGRKEGLCKYLPERRARRSPSHAGCRHGRRFPPELSILYRPDMVARRKQFGHWEWDLSPFVRSLAKPK